MGAPEGNTNSSKNNRLWAETIRRAVVQADGATLRRIADKLLAMAEDGDIQAMKEIGDRLDGKPKQQIEASGEGGGPIVIGWMQPKS
jgi:hypothetical protein